MSDIVDRLMTNGAGERAYRLVLTTEDGRDLGGYWEPAVRKIVNEGLAARTCGNCADWGGNDGACYSATSACGIRGWRPAIKWPADHGCPSHRLKTPEASDPGRAPHLHADGTATEPQA